jgi:LysM repeat protein
MSMIRRLLLGAVAVVGLMLGLVLTSASAFAQGTAQSASATAQAAPTYETVTVQVGDTLAKIAARYCTTWQEIYRINYGVIGDDPSYLEKGMVLTVPNECSSGGSGGGYGGGSGIYDRGPITYATGTFRAPYYYVAWGDTLNGISRRFGVSVNAIMQTNYLPSSNIYAGQALVIPGTGTPPSTPNAERVQFAWGAVSATRSGYLNPGEVKNYVLEAGAGQTMQVIVNNYGSPLAINVTGPGAVPRAAPISAQSSQSTIRTTLPTTGDYVIAIGPAAQGMNYTVTFIIQ